MTQTAVLETYFLEQPLALNVVLFLLQREKGMTATDLAEEFGVSVPTMYRLTADMERLGLLEGERVGRRNVFTVRAGLSEELPRIAEHVQSLLRKKSPIEQKLIVAKKMLTEYPVSLSPRASQLLVGSVLKQKVLDNLPHGLRKRQIRNLRTGLGEHLHLDLVVGTNDKTMGIELKIIEIPRHVHDLLGFIGSLTPLRRMGLRGLVVVCLIAPLRGKWLLSSDEVENILRFQDRSEFRLIPIVELASQSDILDPEFLEKLAKDVAAKVWEGLQH